MALWRPTIPKCYLKHVSLCRTLLSNSLIENCLLAKETVNQSTSVDKKKEITPNAAEVSALYRSVCSQEVMHGRSALLTGGAFSLAKLILYSQEEERIQELEYQKMEAECRADWGLGPI